MEAARTWDRVVKHLDNAMDFSNIHKTRLAPILTHLREITVLLPHWQPCQKHLAGQSRDPNVASLLEELRQEYWQGDRK